MEELYGRNPTNPNTGALLGRSIEINPGQLNQAVFTSEQCNIGDMLTFCLTQRDAPISGGAGQDPNAATSRMSLVCNLQWRVGQTFETCDVDWLQGTLLTIPSGNVDVNCSYPKETKPGVTQPQQHVGVMAAPLIRPGGLGIMPLARLTTLLPALPTGLVIPKRAQAVSLLLTDPTKYGTISLEWRYTRDVAAGADVISLATPASAAEQVIPNGARSVYVGPAAATLAVLVWSIAL
jgi:hypothetical protein